jgi:chromosome segregation ATPase
MSKRALIFAAALLLAAAPVVVAQGRGGKGGGGQHQGQPSGQQGQQPDMGQRGGQQGQGQQQGTGAQQRQQIHATNQQRGQYENCTQSSDRVRTQAHKMADAAKGGGANNAEFREQHQQLRNEIRTMQQENERFMNGLSDEQRAGMQDRTRSMDQARDRLNNRMQQLDEEIAKPEPDRKRIGAHVTEVEKAMKEWQKQYRNMGSDMGIQL